MSSISRSNSSVRKSVTFSDGDNRVRYDHAKLYRVEFTNDKEVHAFQKLEAETDSMQFIGHARESGQKLSILVMGHKVADMEALLNHYKIKYTIQVSYIYSYKSRISIVIEVKKCTEYVSKALMDKGIGFNSSKMWFALF